MIRPPALALPRAVSRALPRALSALALLLVWGCASTDRSYPSLAPRAIEKLGFAEPEIKTVDVAPDPKLDTAISDKRQQLKEIAAEFDLAAATATAAARAAKGQTVGSDAWLDAQTQLAGLDDWRAQASSLVTDIDTIVADRAADLAPVYAPLIAVRDAAVAEAARQGEIIARIETTLSAA